MTHHELDLRFKGFERKQKEHYQDLLFLAWHIEGLARTTKMPALNEFIGVEKKKKMTSEDALNASRAIIAAFGGINMFDKKES